MSEYQLKNFSSIAFTSSLASNCTQCPCVVTCSNLTSPATSFICSTNPGMLSAPGCSVMTSTGMSSFASSLACTSSSVLILPANARYQLTAWS